MNKWEGKCCYVGSGGGVSTCVYHVRVSVFVCVYVCVCMCVCLYVCVGGFVWECD